MVRKFCIKNLVKIILVKLILVNLEAGIMFFGR